MASTTHLPFSPLLSLSKNPIEKSQTLVYFTRPRISLKTHATGTDLVGDFGARDPFPAEIESNFGDKVLGNVDTEHKILIPTAAALSLSQQQCSPISHLQQPLPEDEAKKMLFKVVGWRLIHEEGGIKLQGLWKLRDFKCAVELINRICRVVESTGHFSYSSSRAAQSRGLSMNDFIVAAKIDEIKTSDLVPRKRVWA
ncbi:Transcriptional coactivator/pterin dehydratase [Abeliophyllum distichum]|uniref:4a-hydroxytetrahydrobiopterin dehydratase n=1 Tax=Abeliophyllum distichum TaxID=126358 RepID=A0ABD1UPI3_9LAMI